MNPSFDNAIAFAADLIRIPSPPGGEGEVARRLHGEMEVLGFDEAEIDEVGNVIGRVRGRGEAPPVMLSCHLDIVDPGDPEGWEHPPYAGVVADGHLHGRGAMDIKGPLALQTYTAARFLDDRPAGDIIVAHTVLEERGGWGMAHLMESGRVEPGVVIVGESTKGDICIGHRGRAEVVVEIHGLAGHASAPDRARNALDPLPVVLTAIRELAEAQAESDPVLGESTLVPTQIDTLPGSRNVIPDTVRIVLDWRVLPSMTPDRAVSFVQEFLRERVVLDDGWTLDIRFTTERQRTYTGVEEDRPMFSPGFLIPTDHPLAAAAVAAVAEATGTRPSVRPWTFATDGGHICGVHGVPVIGYAPGEERYAHTNTERLELQSARVAYEAHPPLIRALHERLASLA